MKPIRYKILDAAGELFRCRGYACVGVNEIIAVAGVSKAGFYQNFRSKETLCVEWLRETHRRSEARHAEILASPDPPCAKVEAYFASLAGSGADGSFRGCPFSNTAAVADAGADRIHAEIEAHKIFLREFFTDLVRERAPDGGAETLGSLLFLLYSGAATEARNLRSDWPIRTAASIARRLCETDGASEEARRKKELLGV